MKDGEQALEILENNQFSLPDYIFLDLRMPKINGRQCLVQIKSDERLKHIPVIVYTTSKEVQETEEMQGLGAVHFHQAYGYGRNLLCNIPGPGRIWYERPVSILQL